MFFLTFNRWGWALRMIMMDSMFTLSVFLFRREWYIWRSYQNFIFLFIFKKNPQNNMYEDDRIICWNWCSCLNGINVGLPQRVKSNPGRWEPNPKRNSGNVVETSTGVGHAPPSSRPPGLSRTSSAGQRPGPGVYCTIPPWVLALWHSLTNTAHCTVNSSQEKGISPILITVELISVVLSMHGQRGLDALLSLWHWCKDI